MKQPVGDSTSATGYPTNSEDLFFPVWADGYKEVLSKNTERKGI
jgi:hypothetical protein